MSSSLSAMGKVGRYVAKPIVSGPERLQSVTKLPLPWILTTSPSCANDAMASLTVIGLIPVMARHLILRRQQIACLVISSEYHLPDNGCQFRVFSFLHVRPRYEDRNESLSRNQSLCCLLTNPNISITCHVSVVKAIFRKQAVQFDWS